MQVLDLKYEELDLVSDLQPEGWNDIKPSFSFYLQSSFCFPIKVMIDDRIVGLGAAIIHNDVAWFGHIIVHADQRGKGIGKCITQSLIDIAKQHTCETVYLIATQLGAPVYERLGFIHDTEYLFFKDLNFDEKELISAHIIPYEQDFKTQISTIDKIASGENRMMHLEAALESGFVYMDNDKIEGFYLPALGEGLIVANNSSAGLELLKLHLSSNEKAAFPADNLFARDFLYGKGFKEYYTEKHMRLGNIRPIQLGNIYNRIGGNTG
ncbi:GNAT family N-acetyltransferase [Pedobacter africanus]|uniref:Acetyltransferase (GNAT) family protein n=1 Tax=Pedobacter africanus TaxID=151894 RepID=A0A1W1ZUY0_9SPHI|nr:GNAT family N-acetyltransferase [Pedobacter africanus]SMC52183.1 Acetyltransferase (GNAT) family protein [Pedobacter africanus]